MLEWQRCVKKDIRILQHKILIQNILMKKLPENPEWIMVDIEAVKEIESVGLPELKANPSLEGIPLLQHGQRLFQPVSAEHFAIVCQMGGLDSNSLREINDPIQ